MAYISEELNDGYYRDNNSYTEIGELHANNKNAVLGKIDSRYRSTKKTSLLSPDSDRIIYNFSSDSRVADMAIREAHESITEKMIFVGKDFLSLYDSESGNFVLKEPHDFLQTLRNPYADIVNPGLGSLDIADKDNATEKLSYNSFNYVCKNLKYVISVDTYFLIISKLDNGKYVIFRFNPDTLTISKFKPRAFYIGPGSEEILDKPFVKDNALYLITADTDKHINFWSTSINDESADFTKDSTSLANLGTGEAGRLKYTKVNDIVKVFNVTDSAIKAYAFDLSSGISSGFTYTISGESENADYSGITIKELKTVDIKTTINIILLLSNGTIKVFDNGYTLKTVNVVTKSSVNPISYFIENINNKFTSGYTKVLRFYDSAAHCRILFNDGTNSTEDSSISLLDGSAVNSFTTKAFAKVDELVSNYDGKAVIVDYLIRDDHTIIIGYYSENGVIKPLIKDFYDKHCTKSYPNITNEDKEYYRPFNNGLEADTGISVVKNIPFGTSKLVQVKLNPIISSNSSDDENLYLREDNNNSLYTKGSDLWEALKESGIPYNTHISTIGRIILDGYDIPIESVLITPPDTEDAKDYGSTLLSFDKNFDVTTIDNKYLKLGNIVYPGILFKNNKGFLNDAMISNVYNAEGAISYYDANNGNLFETSLALDIKAALHININNNDILVLASNNGKIASLNLLDGSYITSEGNVFGNNSPAISSSKISDYSFAKDGEILTIVNNSKNVLTILYTSGKIIQYNISADTNSVVASTYVSEKDCGTERISAAYCIFNDTIAYVVNDDNKELYFFNYENGIAATNSISSFTDIICSNTITINNNVYFCNEDSLNEFNTTSQITLSIIPHGFELSTSNLAMIVYDYNDRIYIANGATIKYYSLSEHKLHDFISNKITVGGFFTYIGNNIITVNKNNNQISVIDSEGNITVNSADNVLDVSNSKNKFIVSETFKSGSTLARNIILYSGDTSECATISAEGSVLETIKKFALSDNVNLSFYGNDHVIKAIGTASSNENYSSNLSISKITDITEITDVSSTVTILGFANNILYSIKDSKVRTKDFRKIHDNNYYLLQANLIKLTSRSKLTNNITSLGFVDNGNVLAIGYDNGAIESIFIPEYNSGNGFFNHDYGDVLANYIRTSYVDCTPETETNLSKITVPVENGWSFIGWSYSQSESDIISVESVNAISSIVIAANQKIYAVMKDNSEEYVDRSPERLYAKAGEFFNESIISIETVGDDTYFNTSTKSIRWANDIGVFFNGHDEYFTDKNSSPDFIYNHGINQSKLYINDAGKVNVGKYIFYINGYNPLDLEPQTSVHNGIVVYDSQFDEYAVLSSGKDKLHGTILSRIRPYCYYNNGYIYIFGGLERRDIHTSDGNNYSKLNRTNKIERYDVRSGEFCILEALYGPGDEYVDDDNTTLKYCGEKEIRVLSKVDNVLKGNIRIAELSVQYSFTFDLATEMSSNVSKTYESSKIATYYLSDGTEIELAKSGNTYKLGSVDIITNPNCVKTFEPEPIENGEYLFFIEYLKDDVSYLDKYLYNSNKELILTNRITSKSDKLGRIYLNETNEASVDKIFDIGNNEHLLDNSPITVESRTKLSYKIGKVILKNITKNAYKIEDSIVYKSVKTIDTANDVYFDNDIEYIVSIISGKLSITKYTDPVNTSTVSTTVTGTKFKGVLQKDEDILTLVVYNNDNTITEILNYRTDGNKIINRRFVSDVALSDDSWFNYNSAYKAIFVSSTTSNGSFIIQGLSNEASDNDEAITFAKVDINLDGYNLTNYSDILGYKLDTENSKLKIYSIDYSNGKATCVLKNSITVSLTSSKKIIGEGECIVSFDGNKATIIDDSLNSETIIIGVENYKISEINKDYLEYFYNDRLYRIYRNYKGNFNAGSVIPTSINVPKSTDNVNNANICKYRNSVYIASATTLYRIDLKNDTTRAFEILDLTDELILGIGAYGSDIFIITTSGNLIVINISTFEVQNTVKFVDKISNTANVKFTVDEENRTVYFLINSTLYKYSNESVDEITNSLSNGQLMAANYIKIYDSIYYIMLSNSDSSFGLYTYNLTRKTNSILKTYTLNSINAVTSEYVNVSKAAFYPNIMIDDYGNINILGGNSAAFDGNPSHNLAIIGSRYDDYIETNVNDKCLDLAYSSCIDDNYIYTLGINKTGYADLIISSRNENEYKGSTSDLSENEPISSSKLFTFNNELYGFDIYNKTNQIVKYNKSKKQFDLYSLSAVNPTGTFVSAKAFEDGSLYLAFAYYNASKIYMNVICYNLNTKKEVYNVTDEIFDNTNAITKLSIANHSCWRGKYLITKINTYTDSVLVVVNILKRSKICVKTFVTSGSTFDGNIEYFNGDITYTGDGNNFTISNLINPDNVIATDADLNDSSASIISGNRLLITGMTSKEITTKNSFATKSVSKIIRKNELNKSYVIPYLDNTVLSGTREFSSTLNTINNRPDIYDLIKSPIKEIKLSSKFGLRIYSGSIIDRFVTYDISNYDIVDTLDIFKEYGSSISDIVKYTDNGYLIIHSNTPNISTFFYNEDTGKITIKRYDGTIFGESTNVDTNAHTIQQVDLTMIFDNDMDERAIRNSN